MKTTSSHPDRDNPPDAALTSSADKATPQPKKEAPGKREHRSPSPVEDATDDTEFKQTEELPHSEERFRLLVEGVKDYAIFTLDPEGRITSWNAGAERIKGYSAEEIVGRYFSRFYTERDVERGHPEEELRLAEEQGRYEEEGWRVRKDGTRLWANVLITALRDGEGNLRGFSKLVRDVTERRESEEALRESEERFRSAFEEAPIGVALVDLDGRRFRANRALCDMLGCSEEDLLEDYLEHVHPDDRQVSTEHFQRTLEGGAGSYELERRYLHADGHVVWNLTSVSLVRDSKGNPKYFVCLHQDITERKEAEEKIRFQARLLDAVGEAVIATDPDGKVVYWNQAAVELYGWTAEEVMGRPSVEVTVSEHMWERADEIMSELRAMRSWSGEYEMRRKDGTLVPALVTITSVHDEQSNLVGIIGVSTDITGRTQAEEALRESEEFFRALYEKVHHPIFLIDKDLAFVDVNPYACEFFGYSREEFKQMKVSDITIQEDFASQQENAEELRQEGEVFIPERRLRKKNGEIVTVTADIATVTRSRQELYVGKITDITERKEAEKRLHYQATHDLLTDLPNRHLFMDRLKRALRRTRRTRGRKVAVLYLDLDNFKTVNDSLGHEAGDLLLVMVGERLRWCLRPEDTLARFGGDEFAILIEEVEAPSDAAKVAERIMERFREPLVLEGREFVIRPSIGIALGEARQQSAQDLLRNADAAMYQTKGRDEDYRVFEPAMYEQALRRLKLEGDLRRATEDEEFVVCYQPIVDLESGKALGVEALVRWEHPEWQSLVSPSQFIPVAEEAGLVVPMGKWVLEEACRQGVRWHQEHPHLPPLFISVNLSAKQLQHPDVAETIEEILKKTGFEACCLSLDVTETLYIEALEGNTAALNKLKEMGVSISIDDFGTGYSSLAYLKRLPADALKIDKSFIRGIEEDLEDTAIVKMIIDLAHTLGMEVIAEGVESEGQAQQLKEMGCDQGQGFYFSEPLSPQAVTEFLAR